MSTLDDEIEALKRKMAQLPPHKTQSSRPPRNMGERLTPGKRIIKLEKRMKELEVEVERLRSMIMKSD